RVGERGHRPSQRGVAPHVEGAMDRFGGKEGERRRTDHEEFRRRDGKVDRDDGEDEEDDVVPLEPVTDQQEDEQGDAREREEERDDAVPDHQRIDGRRLGLRDRRVDEVLHEVALPRDHVGEVPWEDHFEEDRRAADEQDQRRDREDPRHISHQEERKEDGQRSEEQQDRNVEEQRQVALHEVVRGGHREGDQTDDPSRGVEAERVDLTDPLDQHRDQDADPDHNHAVRVTLPGQGERPQADTGEDAPLHRRPFRPQEGSDAGDVLAGLRVALDVAPRADGLDRTQVRVHDDQNEERVEREIVRVPEGGGIYVRAQEREDERGNQAHAATADLSSDQVDGKHSERGPERGLEVEEPRGGGDGVTAERGGEEHPQDRVHPVEQRLSRVDRSDRESEHRVPDEVAMVQNDV